MNKKQLKNEELSSSFNTFRYFINKNFLYLFLIVLIVFPIYKLDKLEENIINSSEYSNKKNSINHAKYRDQSKKEYDLMIEHRIKSTKSYFLKKETKKYERIYYSIIVLIFFFGFFIYYKDKKKLPPKSKNQLLAEKHGYPDYKSYLNAQKKSNHRSKQSPKNKKKESKSSSLIHLSLEEFQNKYKSLKSYNSKTNKEVFKGKVLKAFIGSSYSTYGMILIIKNTEKLSDWDSIKKHVKDLAKNSNNDGVLMITSIESIGLLDFDFGQLDRSVLLELAKYMTGVTSEKELDDIFRTHIIKTKKPLSRIPSSSESRQIFRPQQ